MTPSNNRDGFTLIEIMMTVAMIGIVIVPLFSVQYNILKIISQASDQLSRIFLIETIFNEAEYRGKQVAESGIAGNKKVEEPLTEINYAVQKPNEKSAFIKFNDVYVVRATASWSRAGIGSQETMMSFAYMPVEQEKK